MSKTEKGLIVKSNQLIEASYRLGLIEQKVILKIVSQIQPSDVNLRVFNFKINDFQKLLGVRNNSVYVELRKITRDLTTKPITIVNNNKVLQVTWLSAAEYMEGKGEVNLEISSFLAPYLLQIKERFTKYLLKTVIQLKSAYSIRVYELLKQYEKLKVREFEITDLRKKVGLEIDEYKLYADFRRKILLVSQKELYKKTDIWFDFEEIKGARGKVVAIKFIIHSKKTALSSPPTIEDTEQVSILEGSINDIITQFKLQYNGELNYKLTKKMVGVNGVDHVIQCLNEYQNYIQGRTIRNIAGDFYKFVMEGYTEPVQHSAPIPQHVNFDQRNYEEEDLDVYYSNV